MKKALETTVLALLRGLIVFALTACALPVLAQPNYRDDSTLPKGKPGARIQSLIAVINANDAGRIKSFIETECADPFRSFVPVEEHIAQIGGLYSMTGGVDFHSIRSYTPERPEQTVVIVKDRNYGGWHGISLKFEAGGEQRITEIQFNPARTPTNIKEPELSEAEFLPAVQSIIDKLCNKDAFSGTVLIAKGDKIILERVCGEADKGFHVANNMDTKFNLGSMNKMFTATAVAQLAESGKLSFDDPISKYVDESWLPRSITDKVTVHHLLTHTSGLGSYFNDNYWKSSRELYRAVDDYKPLVQGDTLSFSPGERFQYSNTGMLLLGVVIEKAGGQDYFDYIRDHIYKPAGMANTDCYELDYPIENLAIGYIPAPQSPYRWQTNTFKHVLRGGPAGGGYSTARDLYRYAQAMTGGKLVSKASLERMWTSHSEADYGYGYGIDETPNGKIVGHSGGFPGLNSQLNILLGKGYVVAVMSNYDQGATPLANRIVQLIGKIKT